MTGLFRVGHGSGALDQRHDAGGDGRRARCSCRMIAILTGLDGGTTYYYQAIVRRRHRSSYWATILSFTTLAEQTFEDGGVSHPLTWITLTKKDGTKHPYSEVDLNDPEDYYDGYKRPRVERFLTIARGLSDRDGQIEHMSFGAVLSATSRRIASIPIASSAARSPTPTNQVPDEPAARGLVYRRRRAAAARPAAPGGGRLRERLRADGGSALRGQGRRLAEEEIQPQAPRAAELAAADHGGGFSDVPGGDAEPAGAADLWLARARRRGCRPGRDDHGESATDGGAGEPSRCRCRRAGAIAGVTRYYKVGGHCRRAGNDPGGAARGDDDRHEQNDPAHLDRGAECDGDLCVRVASAGFRAICVCALGGRGDVLRRRHDADHRTRNRVGTDWLLGLRLNLFYYVWANLGGGLFSLPGSAGTFLAPFPPRMSPALHDRDIDVVVDGACGRDGRVPRRSGGSPGIPNWDPVYDRQWDPATGVLTVADDLVTTTAVTIPAGELIAVSAAGQAEAIFVGVGSYGDPTPITVSALLVARHACARVGAIYIPQTTEGVEGETATTYAAVPDDQYGVSWFAPDHAGLDLSGEVRRDQRPVVHADLHDGRTAAGQGARRRRRHRGRGRRHRHADPVARRSALHFMVNFVAPDTPWASGDVPHGGRYGVSAHSGDPARG